MTVPEWLIATLGFFVIIGSIFGVALFCIAMSQIYTNRKTINAILNELDFKYPKYESMLTLKKKRRKK